MNGKIILGLMLLVALTQATAASACSTCCSHDECPSDKYCSMGSFQNGATYNQCDPIEDCVVYNDGIYGACPTPDTECQEADEWWMEKGWFQIIECGEMILEDCGTVGNVGGDISGLTGYQACPLCGQCAVQEVLGCTDAAANNYNAAATKDDGSCSHEVLGCTDAEANNYNAAATQDDGSCSNQCQQSDTWWIEADWMNVKPTHDCEDVPLEDCGQTQSGVTLDDYVDGGHDSSLTGYQACTRCGQCTAEAETDEAETTEASSAPSCLDHSFACGSYCEEISWQLTANGQTVCSAPAGSKGVPSGDCCIDASTVYTLQMSDSYGDGWNGGKLVIGDEEYTLSGGSSESVEIAATTVQEVPGCTDTGANNYNVAATQDDGSCTYPVPGCTDTGANNYNAAATQDDGSCTYPVPGCTDAGADNYNSAATQDDGSCTYTVYGCTDSSATNYNVQANEDDGSCTYASSCLDHSFACGSYCEELSWQLTANGQTVCSAPAGSKGVFSGDCCIDASTVYALQMSDSYGDGWNGGQLTIGTETFTLSSGASGSVENPTNVGCDMVAFSGAEVDMCGVCGGDGSSCGVVCMDYSFTCGSYCGEVSWLLKIGGSIICSGSGGVAGECCPEAIKSYTLHMSDSYGDGWNGGKLVIGDEEYTLSGGSSESVEIAATAVPAAPSNEATVITMATSLTIGDNDDADEAAGVAAGAFANSVGADSSAVSYNFVGRRVRRLLGQSLDLELSLTTTDSSLAESAFAAASSDDFSASMAAEMENVAAEMGVTVTVESLEAEAPTESTIVTGCPSLAKTECKADSSCFYHKHEDSCYDPTCSIMHSFQTCEGDNGLNCQWVKDDELCREMPVGCPKFIKKKECKADDTCSWIDDSCVDKTPGCGGFSKKNLCKADDTCQWNSSSNSCVDKPDGCGAHTKKKICWGDSELVCAWNFDMEKCQGGECVGMEKKECKGNTNKCTWGKDKDGVKTCSAV